MHEHSIWLVYPGESLHKSKRIQLNAFHYPEMLLHGDMVWKQSPDCSWLNGDRIYRPSTEDEAFEFLHREIVQKL